jgi:SAM-dependent methyltransferase
VTRGVHQAASRGFQAAADAYERGRPGYPAEAVGALVAALGIAPGRTVLDLAAGTGKLTRDLTATGAEVIAVEPVEAMRRKLAAFAPAARVFAGTAEAIPVGDASVDAVTIAQAFHWFDARAAIEEIHRVLRPGGRLALVWNVRDEVVGWVHGLTAIIEPHRGDTPTHRSGAWRRSLDRSARFSSLQRHTFRYEQRLTPDEVVDRVASVSFIAALPPGEYETVAGQVRALLAHDPQTRGLDEIVLPYRTDVYWCDRVPERQASATSA